MKLRRITIEGMHKVTRKVYDFDDGLSYLYGKNGAGKSTLLQAIQLAVLGYIPGTNKTNSEIFRHANNHTMAVTAILDDNSTTITIRRIYMKSGNSVKCTVDVSPEGYSVEPIVDELELPIFNFDKFISMSSNMLKDWFINFLPKTDKELDWSEIFKASARGVKIVDEEFVPYLVKRASEFGHLGNAVDNVRQMNSLLKEEQTAKKAELSRIQNTIQSLIYYSDIEGIIPEEELNEKLNALQKLHDDCIRNQSLSESNSRVATQLKEYTDLCESLSQDEKYSKLKSDCDTLLSESRKLDDEIRDIMLESQKLKMDKDSKSAIIQSNGVCQYTGEICPSIVEMISDFSKQVEKIQEKISDCEKRKGEIQSERIRIQEQLSAKQREVHMLDIRYRERDSLKSNLRTVVSSTEHVDIDMIKSQMEEISDRIVKQRANEQYDKLSDKLVADKYAIEQNLELLKLWIAVTGPNGMQSEMMIEPFNELAEDMTKYIRSLYCDESLSARFELSEKANSFTFGLDRNGIYIPFDLLSSGEKCTYTLALMLCILFRSNSNLKLLLIDDILDHLDEENVKNLFESLSSVKDIQIIMAGVQKCPLEDNNIVKII